MKFLPASLRTYFKNDLLALFALALVIRLLAALPQQQPNYMDAAYSYVNAVNLAEGQGFVEDFVWNYLDDPAPPPHPSHLYWMPLTSILAWLGMAIGGVSYRSAQISFIILSAGLAPISYGVAYSVSGQRRHGWLAGLLAIFSGFYFPFWTAIDNFTPFAIAGSLALFLAWRGLEKHEPHKTGVRTHRLAIVAAGVWAGLAHLARADGPLLLIAIIAIGIFHLAFIKPATTHHVLSTTLYLLLGYMLIMTPWLSRNWLTTGRPLPIGGSQTIWLLTANDLFQSYAGLFSYGHELSAQTFFGQGLGPIIQGRWWALTANLQTVLAVWGMIFLAPLALLGFWCLRHHLLMQLAGLYGLLLLVAMTFVFAFPGALGGLFHSGTALLPFIYAAGLVGLDNSVDWLAARRRHWHAPLAKRVFGLALVMMAILLSGFIYYGRVLNHNAWNNVDLRYPAVAAWVAQQNPNATVMINNPPAYIYHGGGLSVVVPNEDIETTLQAAHQYQVDYLILDANRPAPLAEIYDQTEAHPQLSLAKRFGSIHIFKIEQE